MSDSYRIIDANLNRAREALRVAEEYARFILNDSRLSSLAKTLRSGLQSAAENFDSALLLAARDTSSDVGTAITSETEHKRQSPADVALAASKRVQEALRAIEEYAKVISSGEDSAKTPRAFERLRYDAYVLEQLLCARGLLRSRFAKARIYVLLTSSMCSMDPVLCAHAAIAGGADCIQLREKNMDDDKFLELARRLRALTLESQTLFIVNDRPDIAAIVDADGLHLGQGDLPATAARQIVGGEKLIGLSTHSAAQASAVADGGVAGVAGGFIAGGAGVDYIGVGPMFETATKASEPVQGLSLMNEVAALELDIPHVAIGGIDAANVAEVARAGARMVAVCSAVIASDDPAAATAEIRRNFLSEFV